MLNLFAYGSNISSNRMLNERKVNFISRKLAVLENYKLVFNKVSKNNVYLGYANIEESEGNFVEGALYEIYDLDLKIIDKFEGAGSKPSHYYKKLVEVVCDNQRVLAWVYVANPIMLRENIKPDKKYLNYILEGKDIFSNEYYEKLKLTETLD
jgi:gamma-glutamylcyclotransferase